MSEITITIDRIVRSKDHYDTLSVEKDADDKVLKKTYRRLALQLHPDKCQEKGAEEAFKKVSNAYAALSNVESRSHYDRFGSDIPASGPGGFNGFHGQQDPSEFFREFMSKNPDFAAAMSAGVPEGETGINLSTFNFSAATLAGGKEWWEIQAKRLPSALRVPFRLLGLVLFTLLTGFFKTMPYSGLAAFALAMYLASKVIWWVLNHMIWLLAFGKIPSAIKPRFWIWIRIIILLVGEYLGFVFDFRRGTLAFVALWVLNRFTDGVEIPSRQEGPFGFTFQGGPSFVHVGSMGGGARRTSSTQRHVG